MYLSILNLGHYTERISKMKPHRSFLLLLIWDSYLILKYMFKKGFDLSEKSGAAQKLVDKI